MTIDWSSLAVVTAVGAAVTLTVVTLVTLAIVGLSRRPELEPGAASAPTATARAVGGLCLLAVGTIVGYGLYIIAA
jgi:hypothetical protein